MQLEATDALDLRRESQATLDLYGVGREPTDSYARRCLMARRLVERGVRYVQLFINAQIFDNHNRLEAGLRGACDRTDKPVCALLQDLKQRGLLDETLVLVMSEMGRSPKLNGDGRDHWGRAYCNVLAGAGVARGRVVGRTDAIAGTVADRPLMAKDTLATIYHLLGIDPHTTLTDRQGRQVPLVPYGEVIREVLA